MKCDERYPDIEKELEYPWEEWEQELEHLQLMIENKINNSPQSIYLVDGDKVLGVWSPFYSKMLFHPKNSHNEIAMRSFI